MYIFLPLVTMLPIALFTLYIYNSQQGRSPWRGVLGIMIGFLLIMAAFYGILYDSSDINPNSEVSSLTIILEYGYIAITAFLPGAVMGYFVALARKGKKLLNYLLALVAAVFVDGVICTMLALMGYHWGYYFIIGLVLFVLSLIVYRQIRHLTVLDDVSLGN